MTEKIPKLTPRLGLIADLISKAPARSGGDAANTRPKDLGLNRAYSCVADIGTDHAYLPVYLCKTGAAINAIASDIRPGPIERAKATITSYGAQDTVETRLGGGLSTIEPGEADAIVIAGMGGLMIAEILDADILTVSRSKRLILQPMSSIPELRLYLCRNGFNILAEYLAKEERKLYVVMDVTYAPERRGSAIGELDEYSPEIFLGRKLIENRPEHFDEYIEKQKRSLLKMADGLKNSSSDEFAGKLKRCEALIEYIEKNIERGV